MLFVGYEALAVSSSSVGFASIPGANPNAKAIIRCETGAVRMRADGIAPTASTGFPLNTNDVLLNVSNLAKLQFIAQSGAGVVHAMYFTD